MKEDKELEILLAEFRKAQPTEIQVQKWKRSLKHNQKNQKKRSRQKPTSIWLQLIAASVVGFIVGALVFGRSSNKSNFFETAENYNENATIEYVFNNSN